MGWGRGAGVEMGERSRGNWIESGKQEKREKQKPEHQEMPEERVTVKNSKRVKVTQNRKTAESSRL